MPDEYLPPNKILFLQNLPDNVTKDQLMALFSQCVSIYPGESSRMTDSWTFRYPNLHEVRLIPTKKDIAFVEYVDEGSATVAKDALHNYKLDGENKIKASRLFYCCAIVLTGTTTLDHVCKKMKRDAVSFPAVPSSVLLLSVYCVYQYLCSLWCSLASSIQLALLVLETCFSLSVCRQRTNPVAGSITASTVSCNIVWHDAHEPPNHPPRSHS